MTLQIIDRPSPNFGARRAGAAIDMLVLHYTGMASAAAALDRLCDPQAAVSAHYLIDEDGKVFRLVDEQHRAWHAGVACWAGERDINSRSIGIELANPGHDLGYRPFPDRQMESLIELARGILARHPIPPHRVLGHSDVAPARKIDPGEKFDWRRLALAGIGIWPEVADQEAAPSSAGSVQRALASFGYEIAMTDAMDDQTTTVVRAFQRHFRPSCCDGIADTQTALVASALTAALRAPT